MGLAAQRIDEAPTFDLDAINARLAGRHPREILRWAATAFAGRLCMQSSMQRRTSTLAHMLHAEQLTHVPLLFVDTGFHFAETLHTRDVLADRFGLDIVTLRSEVDIETQRAFFGRDLWRDPDGYETCCELRKVRPFLHAARAFDGVISGLQRDQGGARRGVEIVTWDPRIDAYKVHPLAEWTREQVDAYNEANDVPVHALHDADYPSIGCEPCTTPVQPGEPERAGRWRHIREMLEAEEEDLYCNINWVDRQSPTPAKA